MKVEDINPNMMVKFSELKAGDAFRGSVGNLSRLFMKIEIPMNNGWSYIDVETGKVHSPINDLAVFPVDAKVVVG